MKNVGILNVGIGNIKSLKNAFEVMGLNVIEVSNEKHFQLFDILVMPGVGNYNTFHNLLIKHKIIKNIEKWIKLNKPTIGICLGGQYLFEYSEEAGDIKGLGVFKGHICKFENAYCNTGWKLVNFNKLNFEDNKFYFNHSYYFKSKNNSNIIGTSLAKTEKKIPVFLNKKNIFAIQFHPEKSKHNGLIFLKEILDKWT